MFSLQPTSSERRSSGLIHGRVPIRCKFGKEDLRFEKEDLRFVRSGTKVKKSKLFKSAWQSWLIRMFI